MADNFWEKDAIVQSKDGWWSQDKVVQELAPAAPAKERTIGEAFKDVGAGLVSGAGSLVQLPGQLYGLATGDFSKTGALGLGEDIAKYGEEMKSAGLKAREAKRAAKVQEAEKEGQFAAFKAGFGETITDPALFTSFISEQVPNILPMILTGGTAAALTAGRASAAALAKGATKEAAAAAGKAAGASAGTTAAVGTGAIMQGADIGAGAYDEIYGELRAKGMSEEQAASETINKARAAGATGFALSLLANRYLPGGKALEEILAGKKITGSRIGSGAVTALKEIPSENIEEVGGRIAQNVAAQQAGLDRELLAGTGETAALATLGGAGIGGAAGALAPRQSGPEAAKTPEAVAAFEKEKEEFRKGFGKAEPVAAPTEEVVKSEEPPEPPTQFPGGYTATRRELSRQEVPESFGIFAEGSEKPLTTVASQEEVERKLQSLTEIRREEQERLVAESDKISKSILDEQRKLEVMEATGQTDTDQYVQAKALLAQKEEEAAQKIKDINDKIVNYSAPLSFTPIGSRTDVQNEFVVNRGEEPVGVFPTLEQAEATLRERDPDVFKQAEVAARTQELETKLKPMLAKFNLGDVGLNVVEQLKNNAGGSYLDKLIQVSLDEANPIQTMRHESMHALKDLQFFTPQQWNALKERAEKQWIKEYLENQTSEVEVDGKPVTMSRLDAYKQIGLTQEEIVEEAIADAFGAYDRGATPPPGMIAALFKKLKNFFMNFGQALRGAGFESAEDVFQRVERGELKSRKPKAEPARETKAEPKPEVKEKRSPPSPNSPEEKLSVKHVEQVAAQLKLDKDFLSNTSLVYQTGKTGEKQFKTPLVGSLSEVVQFLEDRRLATGTPVLSTSKAEDREQIADLMAAEAMASINAGGKALTWYDETVARTIGMAALKYPELKTDPNAQMAFKIATAIASQGLNVEDNLTFADKQYEGFRQNKKATGVGSFNEVGSGSDAKAMVSNFKLANEMIREYGEDTLRNFLQTEFKVEDLRAAGFKITGELGSETVTGSAIFGPKIGFGFYSNLNGNFEPVTMDMWFMRLIGRLTGKLKDFNQELFDKQLQRFRNAFESVGEDGVYANDFKPEVLEKAKNNEASAIELARVVNSVFNSDFINNRELYNGKGRQKTELVYAAQSMIGSVDSPNDAPKNGTERRELRDIVARTVAKVEKAYGKRIPPAALQALVWYPEQELYKKLGVKLRVTSQDYAGAMSKILTKDGYDERAIRAAAQSGSRQLQRMAVKPVGQTGAESGEKPRTTFTPEEQQEFLREARTKDVVKKDSADPKLQKVVFEVAPDPNNVGLTDAWRNLDQKTRNEISERVAKKIIQQAMVELNVDGVLTSQVGSYIDDTNPSFAFFLKSGSSVEVANFLGFVLSQDSMVVLSPRSAPGLDKIGAIVVDVGTQDPDAINKIYQTLREIRVNGEQPIGGQSTMSSKMILLNYSNVATDDLASLVNSKLGGDYNVKTTDVFSAYPEKKDYDYASPENDPRGKAGALRQRARALQAQATDELAKELEKIAPKANSGKTQKLSLRTSFPTAKAAEDAAYDKAPPSTKEFKLFFGGSQIMDEGRPQVMYHGSASEFTSFLENKPIFISPDPDFAEQFAEDRAKDEGKSTEEMRIYPLWVRAETPFDYENSEHSAMVADKIISDQKLKDDSSTVRLKKSSPNAKTFRKEISKGLWSTIEDPIVQDALKSLGFDSFYVQEQGNKNLAVFSATQVKSITGNIGDFSRESKDMRFSLKKVRYSDDRFESLLNSSTTTNTGEEKTAKKYLAFIDPLDFVKATSSYRKYKSLQNELEPVDFAKMRELGPIALEVGAGKDGEWKIKGHEGRHRMLALSNAGYRDVPVVLDFGRNVKDAAPISGKFLRSEEDDSINRNAFVYDIEPLSIDNTDRARSKFTRLDSKPTKYSLPTIPTQITDRIGESTFKRQEQGFIERMIEAISPKSAAHFRAANINRYNQMSVIDKKRAEQMGGAALLADQSAESAALMSDLSAGVAASAMGIGDRNGGIPVLRNGITTIDTSVKGMVASLAPLAAYGDPVVNQRYQYWAMVKRGQRLNKEGKLTGIDSADVAFAKVLEQKHPEFVSVQKDLIAFNNGLVQYMVDTGVLSKERGHEYTKYADYIPFYRQMDGGEKTLGPNLFQSLSGVRPPPKLKGKDVAEAPLADFLETMVRNTQSAIQAGMKNYAAQRAIDVALQVKAPGMEMERLPVASTAPDTVSVLEKGNLVSYRTADSLLIDAMKSLNLSELPFMTMLSAPADLLRSLVTKDPGFMLANLMRDSMSAWVTSGQKMTPIAGTVINFGKALTRNSPGFEAMLNAGIIGGYEFSANIEQSGFKLEEDLKRKAGKRTDSLLLRPFKSVWDALEKGTTASDAATRALIYERVLADTGNEAEALYRSLEVMNFHRKGSSPLIRVLTATVPFFNARLQGLDLFYRASTGNMNTSDAAAIKRNFWARGTTMIFLSTLYWLMVSDDEEYKKQEQETRDNNWIIPSIGAKIPIPFEVGVLFKVIPERIVAYLFGDDTGQDLKESAMRSFISTFAFNPTPQIAKPILEAAFDFNPFTWRSIVSKGMEEVEAKYQVSPSTSEFSKLIAQNLGLSPVKVDHILKGYSGTIGMYGIDVIDMVLEQFGDSPKPTKRFEQLPFFKRFVSDPEARGYVTQYYELKDAVDTTVRTMNLLEKTGESEEYVKYLTKNQGTLAFKDYVRDTEKSMKELREMRLAIRSSQMTGDEKRDALLEISRAESAITSQVQLIKKAIASVQ